MPLQSLSQIRANSSDSPPSSGGGLKSLSAIRQQQYKNIPITSDPEDVARMTDAQNAITSDPEDVARQAEIPTFMDKLGQSVSPSAALQGLKNFGSKMVDDLKSAPQTLNYPFAKAAQYAVPNAPLIGTREDGTYGNLPGTNAQQAYAASNPVPSTGDAGLDKAGDIIGQLAGPMIGTYGTGVGALPGLVDNGLARAGVNFGTGLGGNVAKGAVEGALVGAPFNAAATLATTDPNLSDLANSAGQGALLGGGLGAAAPILSRLGELGQKYAGTKIGDAINSLADRQSALPPEAEQATQDMLALPPASRYEDAYVRSQGTVLPPNEQPIAGTGNIYNPEPLALPPSDYVQQSYRPMDAEQAWQSAYEKIRPVAMERMTPPLENPNELAKWVQQGLNDAGHDVSLNQVRQLSYEDMRTMADEMKNRMNMSDVVRKTAYDMGYGQIFDKNAPSIMERVSQDAQKRTYGIYPDTLPNVQKPNSFARSVIGEAAAPIQKTGFAKTPESPVKASRASIGTKPADRLQSLSEVRSGAKESRLQSPSEIKTAKQEEALNAEVQPQPRIRDKVVNFMNEKAAEAQKRIDARRNIGFLPAQGNEFIDHAIIGAAHIVENGVRYADYSEFMIKKFGNDIKVHLPQIYQQSVRLAQKQGAKMSDKEVARNLRIAKFSQTTDKLGELPNTASQIQSKTVRERVPFTQRANEAYIKGVDNMHRINQFDQTAAKVNGGLRPSDSAYMLGLNARGHDMQASQIVNSNLVDSQGNVIGQSLADVTHQIPKKQQAAFDDYVIAKNAIDRMGMGEKVYRDDLNMTIQKAQAIVDRYEKQYPHFKEIAKQYTQFSKDFGQAWYVDTGMFKQSQWDTALQERLNYVPNQRIISKIEKNRQFGSKGGIVDQSSTVKKAVGSQLPIVPPFESSIENVAKGVKTAKMNEAGQAILRSLRRNPEELSGFAEIVHDQPKMDVSAILKEEGPEAVIDHIHDTFEQATRKPDLTKGNIVTVLENGEPVHLRIHDPQFLEAISNLSPKGQDFVTAFVGKGTKVMKNLTTGVNPIFGLTRNIFRDIPHAFISSKTTSNPIRYGFDLLHGAASVLADSASHSGAARKLPEWSQNMLKSIGNLYNDYKNMGGGHSSATAADRNLLAQTKEKILPSQGIGQMLKRNLITKPYHMLENLNNAAEAAPRLGEYKRVVKQGGGTYDSKVKGLFEANDLTVNFNKYGNVTKNVDAYVPYLNAAVQGIDQLARMATQGGPKRLAQVYAKAIGVITIPSIMAYLRFHNDPDYQKLSNFVKDNYILISKNADGSFTKVAKPKELGMIFGTAVERALRAFQDHDPKAFQDFAHNFLQNMLPPGIGGTVTGAMDGGMTGALTGLAGDTIAGPIAYLGANKDFAGRPIVPGNLKGLSPAMQYDTKTSEPAKLIGGLTNTSPKQLDYLTKSYGGVLGQLGLPLTTKGNSVSNTLKQQVTADPTYSNDISRNFYNAKAQYDQQKADAKAQGKVSNTLGMDTYLDRMATTVAQIRKQMLNVQNNSTLPDTDKQAKLKAMQIQMNNFQQQALNTLQKFQQKAK